MGTFYNTARRNPKLLDLNMIPKDIDVKMEEEDNKKLELELTLGPSCFSTFAAANNLVVINSECLVLPPVDVPVMSKESSTKQNCLISSNKGTVVDLQTDDENKAFSTPSSAPNTAVQHHKRTAASPVVGWPPVRSFRRKLATSSNSKQKHASQKAVSNQTCNEKQKPVENDGLFVKINMDGVPIGRKVDLNALDCSYEKLSSVVVELFTGLLAAQEGDFLHGGMKMKRGERSISGLLDGSGEYTLVYEDNEGDKMLVGVVPWQMFICYVQRLRVVKTSEISSLCSVSKQGKSSLVKKLMGVKVLCNLKGH